MANEQVQEQKDTRTAAQKINDLEGAMGELFNTINNMARDLTVAKDAIKLLGNKADAIVKASASGQPLTDEVLSKIMIDNNVEELKNKVSQLINMGLLKAEEKPGPNSFVVGFETSADGSIANPRLQFALNQLNKPELINKFQAAKVGDVLELEEGKNKFTLQESYEIVVPTAPTDPEAVPAT